MVQCPRCSTLAPDGTRTCPRDGSEMRSTGPGTLGQTAPAPAPSETSGDAAPDPDPLIGRVLAGRFRILRLLGRGGMGEVYAAEHLGLGKQVALKLLAPGHAGHKDVAERLKKEARHASAIDDPHIVNIFDVGETEDGRTFVVMELLSGESLAQRLRRAGPLPEAETVRLGSELAAALLAAHREGIVHRDIKPENIFLCAGPPQSSEPSADFVKVLDFGISKALRGEKETEVRLTQTGAIMGTPLYMSPEQARGEEHLDHRIDIYAFGVVLYECLTGEVPFVAGNYLKVIAQIQHDEPLPPSRRRPDLSISRGMEQVVLRAMARDRDARYPSMDQVLADLRRLAAGDAGAAARNTPAGRPERPRWRWVIGAAGVLLAAGVVLSLLPARHAPAPAPAMTAPKEPEPPAADLRAPDRPDLSPAAAPAASPGGPAPEKRPSRGAGTGPGTLAEPPDFLHDEQAPNPFHTRRPAPAK